MIEALTWPQNQVYQRQLSAAVSVYHTAPSFFLLGRGSNPAKVKWSMKDRILTLAVMQLEAEKCPHCGVPTWHGSTADGRVDFAVEWSVCYGCQEKEEQTKGVKPKPGEWAHVHAVPAEYEDRLPTRSEGYEQIARPLHSGGGEAPKQNGPGGLGD